MIYIILLLLINWLGIYYVICRLSEINEQNAGIWVTVLETKNELDSIKTRLDKKESFEINEFTLPRRVRSRDIKIKDRGQRLAYKQGWNNYRALMLPTKTFSTTKKGKWKVK